MIEKLMEVGQSLFKGAWAYLSQAWERSTNFDKMVISLVGVSVGGCLLFTNGIVFSAALFGTLMMANIILLSVWVPPIAVWLTAKRDKIDITVTICGIALGLLSGQITTVASFIFFGFITSAVLRLAGSMRLEIQAWSDQWKFENSNSFWVVGFRKRKEVLLDGDSN